MRHEANSSSRNVILAVQGMLGQSWGIYQAEGAPGCGQHRCPPSEVGLHRRQVTSQSSNPAPFVRSRITEGHCVEGRQCAVFLFSAVSMII